ncbi:MAG: bifunctional oligoribonuclease/PAP phosphatase NrnA [Clostridia bacterium]|nr:bifunctional oligoribonuclease/PAP phosphatase NrnA [Clostridia bacterium]
MTIPNNIIDALKKAKSICILPHISADGDALGSSFALGIALRKLSIPVKILLEEEVPYIYSFLPGSEIASVYSGTSEEHDLVIALDTGDMGRLGKRAEVFSEANVTINVDHHQTNSEFAFYNYVHTGSSAVGEIVFQMIKMLGIDLDTEMSVCLYVAIATDTGGFRFSNTTAVTHQIAGALVDNGVNVADISQRVFETTSLEKVKLMEKAIGTLELHENGKIAFITITDDMLKSVGAKDEDSEGLVNIGRNIRGVEVAAMLRQWGSGEIKVNFRSNTYVDVAAIANLYRGGGHKRAAGCIVNKGMDEVKKMLIQDIKEAL